MANYEEKKKNVWRLSAIGVILIIFIYLLYRTINDERWIFTDFIQAAILGFIIIVLILYLLRFRKNKKIN